MIILVIISGSTKEYVDICIDENYMENDVACLTTTGDIIVLSLPHLRQQMKVEGIRCDSR